MANMYIKEIGKCQVCLEEEAKFNWSRETLFTTNNLLLCKACTIALSIKFGYGE